MKPIDQVYLREVPRVTAWVCTKCGELVPDDRARCACDDEKFRSYLGQAEDSSHQDDPVDISDRMITREALRRALAKLPVQQRQVLELLYGLGDEYPRTKRDVAHAIAVCEADVDELHSEALRAIQRSADAETLAGRGVAA